MRFVTNAARSTTNMPNKHKYLLQDGAHKIGGNFSGWQFSDAVSHADCPKCGSAKGYHCESPKGRKCWPPHTKRLEELNKTGYKPKT